MPKALDRAKVTDIVPSADELSTARKSLAAADEKKKASFKGSLKNFMKANPDIEAQLKIKQGGEFASSVLEKFMV